MAELKKKPKTIHRVQVLGHGKIQKAFIPQIAENKMRKILKQLWCTKIQ
jgi:hypothetical protein